MIKSGARSRHYVVNCLVSPSRERQHYLALHSVGVQYSRKELHLPIYCMRSTDLLSERQLELLRTCPTCPFEDLFVVILYRNRNLYTLPVQTKH